MKSSKYILICISLLIMINLVISGCSPPVQKPSPPVLPTAPFSYQNASPAPMAQPPFNLMPPREVTDQAVAAAQKVRGVKKAFVFVTDTLVFIGLDLEEPSDKQTAVKIEKSVMMQINSIQSGYTIRATCDRDTVRLIKTVAEGIAEGRSINNYRQEVNRVIIKLTPQGSKLLDWPSLIRIPVYPHYTNSAWSQPLSPNLAAITP